MRAGKGTWKLSARLPVEVSRCAKRFSLSLKSVSPANHARSPALSNIPPRRPCSAPWGRIPGCVSGSAWRTLALSAIPAAASIARSRPASRPAPRVRWRATRLPGRCTSDAGKCIGCWMCVMVCPFGGVSADPVGKKALKCDRCPDRTAAGMDPACVSACPTKALLYLTPEEMSARQRRATLVCRGRIASTCCARRGIVEIVEGRCLI